MKDKCVSDDTNVPDSLLFDLCSITGRVDNTFFLKVSGFIFGSGSVRLSNEA